MSAGQVFLFRSKILLSNPTFVEGELGYAIFFNFYNKGYLFSIKILSGRVGFW
jgi:hypothetical protein